MTAPKLKFNWSVLDRETIFSFMYSLAPDVVNQKLSITDFHKKITNHLKLYFYLLNSMFYDFFRKVHVFFNFVSLLIMQRRNFIKATATAGSLAVLAPSVALAQQQAH